MGRPRTIEWRYLPLLDTREEHASDRVVIDGTLTLLDSGDVIIHDRWFRGKTLGLFGGDPIDYAFPGGHAYRTAGSNQLVIRTGGPDRRTLIYEYQRVLWVLAGVWYQLLPNLR